MPKYDYAIHHASYVVSDTKVSLVFYCDVLGMEQLERPELPFPGAWLGVGDQQIHLLELKNYDPTTGRPQHGGLDRHVALTISDLSLVKADLDAHHVRYTMSKSGRQALFCRDPDGNAVEIIARSEVL
jgi:glyoxylase I family protein